MKLTDWRGNEYEPGSRVIYGRGGGGRAIELAEGTVLDIWVVFRDPDGFGWKRLEEGETEPREKIWDRVAGEYRDSDQFVRTELRVKLQPSGRGSRDFHRADTWPAGYTGPRVDTPKPLKPVVLTVAENITVI